IAAGPVRAALAQGRRGRATRLGGAPRPGPGAGRALPGRGRAEAGRGGGAGRPGRGGPPALGPGGGRLAQRARGGVTAAPGVRVEIHSPNAVSVLASGMVRRDDDFLILEVEFAKKFLSFFKESGKPQEVRVPLDEVTGLTYGCGWGKPPHSVIVKVSRLGAL